MMAVEFELDGEQFAALNGGPLFKFSEAISFQIRCDDQNEVDYFWAKLTDDGDGRTCAAGSRTDTASPGRSCPRSCSRC